jgi:hypothetical protein
MTPVPRIESSPPVPPAEPLAREAPVGEPGSEGKGGKDTGGAELRIVVDSARLIVASW